MGKLCSNLHKLYILGRDRLDGRKVILQNQALFG